MLLSLFSCVRLCATPWTAAHQAPPPWDSPGKNTGVGCHFLLQCMKVKSESEVAQSCPILHDSLDCSPPGFSIHGIFQARVLEWGAIAFSALPLSHQESPIAVLVWTKLFSFFFHMKNTLLWASSPSHVFVRGILQRWDGPLFKICSNVKTDDSTHAKKT